MREIALTFLLVALSLGRAVAAQAPVTTPAPPGTVNVEADPIRCWWRTSTSAVRVGEPFSLILTCAIVENESTTVVPDQSRLEPSAMQLPPFEVVGGQREPDLRGDQRRFFQYQYALRLISEELFGKDVHIPSVQISYHLESRVGKGESVRGRDRIYILPSESVRVLSLVPADASDIRDAPSWTFGDIEAQRFRSRAFLMVATVLFTAAALVLLMALVRYLRGARQEGAVTRRLLGEGAVLRGARRHLAAVRRATQSGEWTPELVARALAAFRLLGNVALGRPVSQQRARRTTAQDGQLAVRGGFLFGKKVYVSGSATSQAVGPELRAKGGSTGHRQVLEQLEMALTRFTAAAFGRETKLDETGLAESLGEVSGIVRRLTLENLWIVKKIKGLTRSAEELGDRAWSR